MGRQPFVLFDGDIGSVKYAFSIQGLSFTDYCQGSRFSLLPLRKRRSKFIVLLSCVVAIAAIFAFLTLIQAVLNLFDITLYATIFQGNGDGDVGFRQAWWGSGVVSLFLLTSMISFLAISLVLLKCTQRFQKKIYLNTQSTKSGYYLELGEYGLKTIVSNGISSFKWETVTDVNHYNGMVFISLSVVGFFLWLPDDLCSDEVTAFIRSKMNKLN